MVSATRLRSPTEPLIATLPHYATDPAQVKRVGIVCGGTLYAVRHTDPRRGLDPLLPIEQSWELPEDYDLHDLGEAAVLNHLGAVWLIPLRGTRPSEVDHPLVHLFAHQAAQTLIQPCALLTWHPLTAGRAQQLCGLVCQRRAEGRADGRGTGMPIGLYAPWLGGSAGSWGFGGLLGTLPPHSETRARIIATAAALAAYTLGMQLRFSLSYTGLQILRGVLARKQERVAIPALSAEWRERLMDLLPHPIQWARPLGVDELKRRDGGVVIFHYDRTMSYPASAGEVPCGDPVPAPAFVPHTPGLYRLSATAPATWWGRRPRMGLFYDPTDQTYGGYPPNPDAVWAWEPQIRLALRLGWDVRIHEGYFWPRAQVHDLFRPWRERVFAARVACAEHGAGAGAPGRLAAALVKTAATASIGRLIQRPGGRMVPRQEALAEGLEVQSVEVDLEGELTGLVSVAAPLGRTDLIWPHAWGTIIANANERLQTAIHTYAPDDTLAGYVDALYTLHNHPELTGAPDGRVQLGRFRLARVLLAQARDLEAMGTQSAQLWVKTAAHLPALLSGEVGAEEAGDGND